MSQQFQRFILRFAHFVPLGFHPVTRVS